MKQAEMSEQDYNEFVASIKPENWHCQKCGGTLIYHKGGVPCYSCERCEMMWPATSIVFFAYADLTTD